MSKKLIRYNQPNISNLDIVAVNRVLKSEQITQGKVSDNFQNALIKYTNSKYCSIFNSASTALIAACKALDFNSKDILWTSAISFVASSNCALFFNSKIDFIDINLRTFNIDISLLKKKLKIAKLKKELPKAIVVVHLGGNPCDLKEINILSKKYRFKIIEDASHALGAKYRNTKIGDCKYSDMCIFSFHAIKMITTGEGGAILAKNKKIFKKVTDLNSHGITRKITNKNKPSWYYENYKLSSNFRLTDFQSALGLNQLKRIKTFLKKRDNIAKIYEKNLNKKNLYIQEISKHDFSSRHLFIILLKKKGVRDKLYKHLKIKKIETNLHYIPIYKHPLYKKYFFKKKIRLENSEKYYDRALSLPIHCNLNKKDVFKIIKEINLFCSNA
tara:strand:- start:4415 stop:5575 length:1161 start_codon:yes stop_codon:yes gene_type:complete